VPKEKKIKSEPLLDDNALQGFLEDDTEEREAALSSPVKGGRRLSSEVRCTLLVETHGT
jgi:hypothetical protein